MVKHNINQVVLLLFSALLLASCTKDRCKKQVTYIEHQPLYKSKKAIRDDVSVKSSQALRDPGKIYFRTDGYLFVGERNEGIHIFDNNDPSNPQNIGYIKIPGNTDMAVRGDVLYANSFVDLYAIDVSSPSNPKLTKLKKDVFEQETMPGQNVGKFYEDKGVLVGFKEVEKTRTQDCNTASTRRNTNGGMTTFQNSASSGSTKSASSQSSGIGGSMARFAIYKDYLYCVDWENLNIFSIANADNPDKIKQKQLGWGIETIFPYKDKLFIGSRVGMYIYDNSNPTDPVRLSEFQHATVCDPVYPTDSYAYVTLNGGGGCGNAEDELNVLNITDIEAPDLIKTYPMDDPLGLAVKNNILFLCQGHSGLSVYDVKDKTAIAENQIDVKTGIHAFDVIPFDQVLMVIGDKGLYQYDYSNPGNLERLSHIAVN